MRDSLSVLEPMSPSQAEAILAKDQQSKIASFIVKDAAMERRPRRWAILLIL
jgi:hypothetical protein